MKTFRFPLGRLERLRGHEERLAQRRLAACMSTLDALEAERATIDANLDICETSGGGDARELGAALSGGLRAARRKLEKRLEIALREAEAARVQFVAKHRDVEALRRLHEARRSAWRTEVLREEQSELDEVARVRFCRQVAAEREGATR